MRALFVGLGSIGRRHLTNLAELCAAKRIPLHVTALRHAGGTLPPEVDVLVDTQTSALVEGERFDVAFITNPTHLHAEVLGMLNGRVDTFFIEKPIFEATGYSLEGLGLADGQKAYVAAPMRWCGVYMALKEKLKQLDVYSVRAICSSYLPDWRKGVDYREVYSARAEMGGGVTLDLIHEWDYLTDLFGPPEACYNLRGQFSHLEISSDDLSVYIARYPGFLAELHLDYFGRSYRRDVEIFTRGGTLKADFGTGLLTLPDGVTEDHSEPANRRYEREMDYFVRYALEETGESVNSPAKALAVLQTTLGET